jgi:subtilisin family serine protease
MIRSAIARGSHGPGAGHRMMAALVALALFAAACDRTDPAELTAPDAQAALIGSSSSSGPLLIVGFDAPPGAAEIALVQSLGGQVVHQYRYIPALAVRLPSASRSLLEGSPGVTYVANDGRVHLLSTNRGKQVSDYGVRLIEAPAAWGLGARGQGVKVGIFDTGIALDHPDLEVHGGIDLIGDGFGFDDCHGHGTHVGGIVAAKDNGHHTVGVAPRARLYAMRILNCEGSGSFSAMIRGLEWAIDNEIQVVNMSFGGLLPTALDAAVDAILDVAYERGIVLVGASGNGSTPYISYPAAHPAVIAVGATDDADLIATFSQWGTEQELTAPGVNNLAPWLVGKGITTSLRVESDGGTELEAIALLYSGMTDRRGITAPAVYVGFGTLLDYQAVDCRGKVAVTMRGGPSFAEKAYEAMKAGCAGIAIHNHSPGNFNGTLGAERAPDGRAWLPAVSLTLDDGLYLKERIESGATTVNLLNAEGNLLMISGTSMASPHAAGVATLVLSRNPSLSNGQVRAILRSSAEDLGTPGWDPIFGHGRVNARRAVEQAN